jgi:hypothetical protein
MSNEAVMDPTQAARMDDMVRSDLRERVKELEALKAEKAEYLKDVEARSMEYENMKGQLEAVKDEKRRNFSEVVSSQVTPFMEVLKKDKSPSEIKAMTRYEENINSGLDNAFMTDDEQAMYTTVTAAASQAVAAASKTATMSSELERLFQSDKAWDEKYSALQKERDDGRVANETAMTLAADESAQKETMLETLRKELGELKELHSKNMMSADNLLEGSDATAPTTDSIEPLASAASAATMSMQAEAPTVIAATASSASYNSYDAIFAKIDDYKETPDWRMNRFTR